MKRQILRFDEDDEGHWRAELECGHYQHVRHDPPLVTREWVLTPEGRAARTGNLLECRKCGDLEPAAVIRDEAPEDRDQKKGGLNGRPF